MTHSELVRLIENFKVRTQQSDTVDLMKAFQNLSSDQSRKAEALQLLQDGINIYQKTDNYSKSIAKIDNSIKLIPSAAGYFNRGVIHWCEHDYYACFKDQCAALLFDKHTYPLAYFYLAHSLYNVTGDADKTTVKNEQTILDFIIEILKEGVNRGDENASKMIPHVIQHRSELV